MIKSQKKNSIQGFTLLEMLVTILISSMLLLSVVQGFSYISRIAGDQKIRTTSQLQAQSVLDMITPELRMLGNGVPFHQANFLIAQENLTDNTVTQPILVDGTTEDQIRFRLNQTGETYIVVNDYDPAASSTITLTGVNKIYENDEVYITNSTVGLDDGLWGRVASVNTSANTVTLDTGYQYSPGSTFPEGSLLEVVPIITYTSTPEYLGVSRDDGNGAISLVTNGQFKLDYLNSEGDVISLPLEASTADPFPDSAIQNVRAIRITVKVRSNEILSTGNNHIATAVQTVGIRNLNYKY